ncbi:uncharacterized protein [Macrobrachium rosenbergii]|uniref:uncharacterized protein n=1 Tax=Macrobrachium rosenbergii TaxID=79674 RepID=UPI0034D44221
MKKTNFLLLLTLFHWASSQSFPLDGESCNLFTDGLPLYWMDNQGQCCICKIMRTKCFRVTCLPPPPNAPQCYRFEACGCPWYLCGSSIAGILGFIAPFLGK